MMSSTTAGARLSATSRVRDESAKTGPSFAARFDWGMLSADIDGKYNANEADLATGHESLPLVNGKGVMIS